jgi:phosphatidylinositol alpha-1,6-mannosyltransferase
MVGLDPFCNKLKKYAVIHGTELNLKGFGKNLIDKALLNFKHIIAVSNYTKSLVAHLKLNNIVVIPNGFSLKIEEQVPIIKDTKNPILITVGNVSERKGQLNVIKALPLLIEKYPKIHYHIVGIPTLQKDFESIAKALNVTEHLTFHGMVTEERKQQLLKESTLFVMLSNKTTTGDVEGFGIAIIEANALGLPAIGSKDTGIEDAIKANYSGKLIEGENALALQNAIDAILADYSMYEKQAKDWSTHFTWDKIIQKYIKALE